MSGLESRTPSSSGPKHTLAAGPRDFSYSSGDIGPCFELGPAPELKFYLEGQSIKLNALSKGFIDIPRMASKFVADKDQTTVAVTFSALDFVTGC